MKIFHFLKGFLAGFLGVFLGIFFFFTVGQIIFPNFYKPYVVLSGSMEPDLKTGSIVFTRESENYQIGDIITFAPTGSSKELVTHRINNIEKVSGQTVYITKGDANEEADTWDIISDQILGKVELHIPYIGYAIDFAKTPQGFIMLVIIPATIVVYEELKSMQRELVREGKKLASRFSKKNDQPINNSPHHHARISVPSHYIAILLPVIGVALVAAVAVASAWYVDQEKNLTNIMGAADSFETPVPSTSPSASPTLEPIPSITPTASPTPTISPTPSITPLP